MKDESIARWNGLKKSKADLSPEEYTRRLELLMEDMVNEGTEQPDSFLLYDEMRALLDFLQISITVTDRESRFLFVNDYFADLYQAEKTELLARRLVDIYPMSRSMNAERNDQLVLKTGVPRLDIQEQVPTKLGERIFTTSKYPFKRKDKTIGILTISLDMTEHTKYIKELERSKQIAEDADSAKGQFLANISHEIRTPLNIIIGNSEILKESLPVGTPDHTYLKGIIISGTNLLNLINDILDLSKVDAGQMLLKKEPLNVRSFLNDIKEIFKVKAHEKGLRFDFDIEESLPSIIWVDEIRLRQVIFNLIGNAVKFTQTGSINLSVRSKIKTKTQLDLFIDIKDTGIGIPPSQQRVIFEPFRQQVGQSTRTFGGTGLGLAISKRLVEAMDGRISVSSNIGIGSVFRIYLSNVEYENEWGETASDDGFEYKFEPAKVLIAEDSEEHLEIMKFFLKSDALTVYEAHNGQEALDKLALVKPDLIIMDIQMPVMNGFKAAKNIRANARFNEIPIVAISSFSDINKQNKVLEICTDYVSKPLSKTKFLEVVSKYIPCQKISKKQEIKVEATEDTSFNSFEQRMNEIEKNGQIQDFYLEFSTKIIDLYNELQLNMSMNNLGRLGFQSLDLGMRYQVELMEETGKRIEECLSDFRLDEIMKLMPKYEKMIHMIKTIQKSSYGTNLK